MPEPYRPSSFLPTQFANPGKWHRSTIGSFLSLLKEVSSNKTILHCSNLRKSKSFPLSILVCFFLFPSLFVFDRPSRVVQLNDNQVTFYRAESHTYIDLVS